MSFPTSGARGASEGIHAVAARIQDRASQLMSERRVLDLVKAEQDQQQAALDEEMESCGMVRREYLSAVRSRHGLELELWKIEEQKKECMASIKKLQDETESFQAKKQEIQSSWEDLVSNVLADHYLNREIYRHSMQSQIQGRDELISHRNQQLIALTQDVAYFRNANHEARHQQTRLQEEIEDLKDAEEEEDKELSHIAAQVHEMIAKVCLLILKSFGRTNNSRNSLVMSYISAA